MIHNHTIFFSIIITIVVNSLCSVTIVAAPGDLDASFGSGGKVMTLVANDSSIFALALQTDGKIVAAGVTWDGTQNDFALARFNADGTFDVSFGANGKVITPMGSRTDSIQSLAIQSDGKIIAGGYSQNATDADFALVRYNADGSLDTTFGTGGKIITQFGSGDDFAFSLKLQTNGKIVIAGRASNGSDFDFALARYNADGSLDNSFGSNGKVLTRVGSGNDFGVSLALQTDGKIIVGGSTNDFSGGLQDFALVRYNPDGTLDTTFGTDGKAITDIGNTSDFSNAIVVQPDGKIVAVGNTLNGSQLYFALVRYNANGTKDSTFGTNGITVTPVNGGNGNHALFSAAIQSNGKIVVAGRFITASGLPDYVVARYNSGGTLDTTFGNAGIVTTAIGAGVDVADEILIQPDGKILAAGWSGTGGIFHFSMARYEGDARIAPAVLFDFDGDRKSDISIFRPASAEWWYQRSGSGQINAAQFGANSDKIVPGDYTGDGKTDLAVWQPASGQWFVLRSEDNSFFAFPFGQSGDTTVPADYDGDGKTDPAVFRPSDSTWWILRSTGGTTVLQFGATGDKPVPADYDGDGRSDIAIWRANGADGAEWWQLKSSSNQIVAFQFGVSSDKIVPGDYTGDGKTDAAVWRPSTGFWYVLRSEDFSHFAFQFGADGDRPAPGDYDGDGKFDMAVFRPSNATWFVNRSTAGILIQNFGLPTDQPVPGTFVP